MKMNKKIMQKAVMHTVLELYKMKDFAEKVAETINGRQQGDAVELQGTKGTGFIIRRKKDVNITDSELSEAIVETVRELIDAQYDEAAGYIADTYEIDFEGTDCITGDLVKDVFEVTRSGRLIYVEVDL